MPNIDIRYPSKQVALGNYDSGVLTRQYRNVRLFASHYWGLDITTNKRGIRISLHPMPLSPRFWMWRYEHVGKRYTVYAASLHFTTAPHPTGGD